MRIMAVDHGDVRTGVAVCDKGEMLASPVKTISQTDQEKLADEIAELAKEEGTLLLRDNVSKLVQSGVTSMDELVRVTYAV